MTLRIAIKRITTMTLRTIKSITATTLRTIQ